MVRCEAEEWNTGLKPGEFPITEKPLCIPASRMLLMSQIPNAENLLVPLFQYLNVSRTTQTSSRPSCVRVRFP